MERFEELSIEERRHLAEIVTEDERKTGPSDRGHHGPAVLRRTVVLIKNALGQEPYLPDFHRFHPG